MPILQAMVLYRNSQGVFDKASEHRLKIFAQYATVQGFNTNDGKILQCKTCSKEFDDKNHALRHLSGHWYTKDGKLRNVFFDQPGAKTRKCHACHSNIEICNYNKHFNNQCIKKELLPSVKDTFEFVKHRHPYLLVINCNHSNEDFHRSINNLSWALQKAIINNIAYKIYQENPKKKDNKFQALIKVPQVFKMTDINLQEFQENNQNPKVCQLVLAKRQIEIYKDAYKRIADKLRIEMNMRKDFEFQVLNLKKKIKQIQKESRINISSDSEDSLTE